MVLRCGIFLPGNSRRNCLSTRTVDFVAKYSSMILIRSWSENCFAISILPSEKMYSYTLPLSRKWKQNINIHWIYKTLKLHSFLWPTLYMDLCTIFVNFAAIEYKKCICVWVLLRSTTSVTGWFDNTLRRVTVVIGDVQCSINCSARYTRVNRSLVLVLLKNDAKSLILVLDVSVACTMTSDWSH